MSAPIKVTFAQLQSVNEQITTTTNNINSQLSDLKSALAPMVSTWSGSAADNYNTAQKQWDSSAEDLNTVLAAIGKALGDAHDGYQTTESQNASRW